MLFLKYKYSKIQIIKQTSNIPGLRHFCDFEDGEFGTGKQQNIYSVYRVYPLQMYDILLGKMLIKSYVINTSSENDKA